MPQAEKEMSNIKENLSKSQAIERFYQNQVNILTEENNNLKKDKNSLAEKVSVLEKELNTLSDIRNSRKKLNSRIEGMTLIMTVLKRGNDMLLNDIEHEEEQNKLDDLERNVMVASDLSIPMHIYSFIIIFLSAALIRMMRAGINFWEWMDKKNRNRIFILEEKVRTHEDLISNQQNTISESISQMSGLQKNISDKEQEIKQNRQEIDRLNRQVSEWKANADNLKNMQQAVTQKEAQLNSLNEVIFQLNAKVSESEHTIFTQTVSLSNLEKIKKEQETKIKELNREIARKENEIHTLKDQITRLTNNLTQTTQELQNAHDKIRWQNDMVNTINNNIAKLQNEKSALQNRIKSLEAQAQTNQQTVQVLSAEAKKYKNLAWSFGLLFWIIAVVIVMVVL